MILSVFIGPNENEPKEEKDNFWEIFDRAKFPVIAMEDLNGRIGNTTERTEGTMGKNLIIPNSFF